MTLRTVFFSGLLAFSSSAFAAYTAAKCTMNEWDGAGSKFDKNVNEMLPIGSVSKIVTTYWALSVLPPQFKFTTQVYLIPVSRSGSGSITEVDLHFKGTRDPYFGKDSLFYLISKLNKMGIYKIRNLTFDENFKFFWNAGGGQRLQSRLKVETGFYKPEEPTPKMVISELRPLTNQVKLQSGKKEYLWRLHYQASLKQRINLEAQRLEKTQKLRRSDAEFTAKEKLSQVLLDKPEMKIESVKFVPSESFDPQGVAPRPIYSSPLWQLLREMNRNSNNHAANQIFEYLGGAEAFKKFAETKGLSEKEIIMYNGHGNRVTLSRTSSVFNSATCKSMLNITAQLNTLMMSLEDKKAGLLGDLHDVLPVPKLDPTSTVRGFQDRKISQSMAAKTGTIGPTVTLAGVYKTKQGNVFFMYIVKTPKGSGEIVIKKKIKKKKEEQEQGQEQEEEEETTVTTDWEVGRKIIAAHLAELTKKSKSENFEDQGIKLFSPIDPRLILEVEGKTPEQLEEESEMSYAVRNR